ncbi:MAG: hypothetical protein IT383_04170 [Deltaproteobacteria bacterium]|nr:hypothetical protein [Deltaproteobacteria bacterium]
MSVAAVRQQISKAIADLRLEGKEATAIIAAAKPKVSNAEAKAIGDLYQMVTAPSRPPPGVVICFRPTAEQAALSALDAFFLARGLPFGKNKQGMVDAIDATLRAVPLPLETRRTSLPKKGSLVELDLSSPPSQNGKKAFLDVAKQAFYFSAVEAEGRVFYGPIALSASTKPEPPADKLTPERKAQILAKIEKLERSGQLTWIDAPPDFARGTVLSRQELRDGAVTKLSAMMVRGVDLPGLPARGLRNVNEINSFWVERQEGRFRTQWAQVTMDGRDV